MTKIEHIEKSLGLTFPEDYKKFLLHADQFVLENRICCRILQDGYRTDAILDEFFTPDNFLEKQQFRDYLIEFQEVFENTRAYVEAEYLYHIAGGTSAICIALDGQHYGKIFSADNGDFGIIYQAENIDAFIHSLYDPDQYRCTFEELIEAVKANNLELLKNLIETKDGNLQIKRSSWLEIELIEIAEKHKFDSLLKYLAQFAHYRTF